MPEATVLSPKDSDSDDETQEILFAQRGCCQWITLFASDRSSISGSICRWERISNASPDKKETWWSKGLIAFKKLREWSELLAGPRWKNFIRRFNKNQFYGGNKIGKFHYDPLSYALNFDDGLRKSLRSDDERFFRDFSSRYAAIPTSAKSSMDLGRNAPLFA
ncbi:hypothetical protein U1Q18_012423 [Sarracenia purpurea var. burkii]